jgi:hypothetical protein
MKITAARGAIAITLDRPRILFFGMSATWMLVEKYGVEFLTVLYTVKGKEARLSLKSIEALQFFLWAGLQEEISDTDEQLSFEQVGDFLRPWTFTTIFNAVVMAVTGAVSTPAPPGKADAAGAMASPPASRAAARKASTSTKRRGSSAER